MGRFAQRTMDKHRGKFEVERFAPGRCPTSKAGGGMEFNQAVHLTKEDHPRFSSWQPILFEGIDYFAMPKEFKPSEWDRRALAAANPEHKVGKRKKLSAQNDV